MTFKTTVSELASWLPQALQKDTELPCLQKQESPIMGVSIDTRTLQPGNLFIAIRGEHFDGHHFVHDAQTRGAAAIIVEHKQMPILPDLLQEITLPVFRVAKTRQALGQIAQRWRDRFTLPVIAVTGSNGKTTVKEMITAILSATYGHEAILATTGNFNNDIGVPLTLLRLNTGTQAAVIELGMNHPGEIAWLAHITHPTVALINNAGHEHLEFMKTVDAVAQENGSVITTLPVNGTAVFPSDSPYTGLWQQLSTSVPSLRLITFGLSGDACVSCQVTHDSASPFVQHLHVTTQADTFDMTLNTAGQHNVHNALAAIACTLAIDCPVDAIVCGLTTFRPYTGRLQQRMAQHPSCAGAVIIDDTYNANPDSVRAAIDVLVRFPAPCYLVFGDMGEVGLQGTAFHREVGHYAKHCGVTGCFTLGSLAKETSTAFGSAAEHFESLDALLKALEKYIHPKVTLLIKGSRFMKMEKVVQHLVDR